MLTNLIKARKSKNLTQSQLGDMIKKSKQTVCYLELGRIEGRPSTWDALEKALGVDQKILRQVDCYTKANNREKAKQ